MKAKTIMRSNIVALVSESIAETDKGVSILLTAELDELLLKILQKKLLPTKSSNNIFDVFSHGSLGEFASRIEITYRLGIIPKVIANNLHVVRNIRNAFAHKPLGLNFNSQNIKDKLGTLRSLAFNKGSNKIDFVKPNLAQPRQAFIDVAYFLIGYLESRHREIKQVKENTMFE